MATSKNPTIVIVGGGWHQPESYKKLTKALEQAGFEVHIPSLPSMNGDRPPTKSLKDDTETVRNLVESLCDDGHDVLVLTHSYGGQVTTNALSGLGKASRSSNSSNNQQPLPGGVIGIIYIAAFALPKGLCIIDKVREFGHEEYLHLTFDIAEDKTQTAQDPKNLVVGPGASEEEVDEYLATFTRWNGGTMYEPLEACAWSDRDIPVAYLHTLQDRCVAMEYQTSMVEFMRRQGGKDVEVFEIETGHCPNLTATGEVVDVVGRFIAKVASR